MGNALEQKKYYTPEEYFALEERAEYKNEYYNGEIFAVAGGSSNHSIICVNLIWGLRIAVSNKDCVVYDGNLKVEIAKRNLFVYPDVMVVCGNVAFAKNRRDIITNPMLVVEVLSPATAAFDHSQKFGYYRTLPSLTEYVLVSQEEPLVESFFKQDEKTWLYTVTRGLEDTLTLHSLQAEIALTEIYQKVTWENQELL